MEGWFGAPVVDPANGYTADDLATHVRTEFICVRPMTQIHTRWCPRLGGGPFPSLYPNRRFRT
jgi:hypothetical protein